MKTEALSFNNDLKKPFKLLREGEKSDFNFFDLQGARIW